MNLRRTIRGPITWLVVAVVLVLALVTITSSNGGYKGVALSDIESQIAQGHVASANLLDKEQQIQVTLKDGTPPVQGSTKLQSNYTLHYDTNLAEELKNAPNASTIKYNVKVTHPNPFLSIIFNLIPFALILLIMFFFLNQMQGGGGRVMQFGKAKAKLVSKDTPKTTFADVAGADEAIEELQEIKEFLENPAKFQAMGA